MNPQLDTSTARLTFMMPHQDSHQHSPENGTLLFLFNAMLIVNQCTLVTLIFFSSFITKKSQYGSDPKSVNGLA